MENVSPLIKTIKAEMKRQEMSVQALSAHCRPHLSFQALYRIFNGEASPNIETVETMARALKLRIHVEAK